MNLYEVFINEKWEVVKCEDMKRVNTLCREKGIDGWRVCGMMSRTELKNYKEKAPLLADLEIYYKLI